MARKSCSSIDLQLQLIVSGSTDDSSNNENSLNTVFIPEFDHEEFVLQQRKDSGSPDVVYLREGLGTSDGSTIVIKS